jgi:hypothetical protein
MSTDNPSEKPKIVSYSSNSQDKKAASEPERPLPKAVVPAGSAVERKKSLGRKFREQFAGDDAQTVGQYLLFDVVIPATKNLIFDLGREGLQRILFGVSRPSNSSIAGTILGSRTSYSSYSRATPAAQNVNQSAGLTPQQRAIHDFSGVILQTHEQAMAVIDVLSQLIDDFGTATLNDFYAAIGETPEFTAVKYGWKSMAQAQVRGIREGYLLELPKPIVLE